MVPRSVRSRMVAVVTVLLAGTSCGDKSPTAPPRVPSAVDRLELQAPAEIAPGESIQLTANAIRRDGSVENVSGRAIWTAASSQVLQVASGGVATGRARGETVVTAHFESRTASAHIFVLPGGTFRLSGTIREQGFGVPGVSVTVIQGIGEGLTATSDNSGKYALYGVGGTAKIHLRRDGYLDAIHDVAVSGHRTADFELVPERPRAGFAGTYTLTITAASTCGARLPESVRRLQYTATMTQSGSLLKVTLSDRDFIVTNGRGNGFSGRIDASNQINFTIGDVFLYYDYFYATLFDIVESVDAAQVVMTAGVVSAQGSPTVISGNLNGTIVLTSTSRSFPPIAYCGSPAHTFEMIRR